MDLEELTYVTGNPGKLKEMSQLLSPITLQHQNIPFDEIQGSIESIAKKKIAAISPSVSTNRVFVEDTCLCFEAFGGDLPGPYIKV